MRGRGRFPAVSDAKRAHRNALVVRDRDREVLQRAFRRDMVGGIAGFQYVEPATVLEVGENLLGKRLDRELACKHERRVGVFNIVYD